MHVICGTNFSIEANKAALAAAAMTARPGDVITLSHVLDAKLYARPSAEWMPWWRTSRQQRLEVLAGRARRRAAQVNAQVVEGVPAIRLVELTNDLHAQLLIIAAPASAAASAWFTGSVGDQAIQAASVPVMVMRIPSVIEAWCLRRQPLRVLAVFDDLPGSESALNWAAALREIAPCEVTVVQVPAADANEPRLRPGQPGSCGDHARHDKFLAQELRQKCEPIFGSDAAHVHVLADCRRADALLIEAAVARRADLIVLGTSQNRNSPEVESVARAVARRAPMNVVCVPALVTGKSAVSGCGLPALQHVEFAAVAPSAAASGGANAGSR
jgi:nucleotide-binding universal stress UspA family protein